MLPLLLVALWTAVGPVASSPALTRDDDALKDFARELRRAAGSGGELGRVVKEGLATLSGLDSPALVETLAELYSTLEKPAAVIELDRQKDLLPGAKDRPDIDRLRVAQDRLLTRLAQVRGSEARQRAGELALSESKASFTLRLELARRMNEQCAPPRGLDAALRSRRSADLQVALELCHRLAKAAGDHVERIAAVLERDETELRVPAARALARLARPEGVEPLIDALEATEGRAQEELAAALEVLTRQPLGRTTGAWRRWWSDHRDEAFAGRLPLGGGEVKVGARAEGYYFGIPQDGRSILYAVYLSKSMNKKLPGSTETRDDRARKELRRAVESLPPDRQFNVLVFADRMQTFADRQIPATPRNVQAMVDWLDALKLELGTNTYGALEMGFHLAGRGPRDRWYESAIDTLFLLSDGRPTLPKTKGKVPADQPERILAAVRRWNPLGRVVVHTIGLGKDARGQFMKKLAAQNGGRHVVQPGD